jgi:hypothetical protein
MTFGRIFSAYLKLIIEIVKINIIRVIFPHKYTSNKKYQLIATIKISMRSSLF